ncbi:hypothetical protein BH11MYX3_BH11MYX3_22000 [soil metagenome]
MKAAVLAVLAFTACASDVDEQWQLDHDRIIAVRASPPGLLPGERSEIDALVGAKGAAPIEQPPQLAQVISPPSLATALTMEAGKWVVTAPDDARLASARTELGLAADAPVPLQIGVSYANNTLLAIKTVFLGEARANPPLEDMMIDGAAAPGMTTPIVVHILADVRLSVKADESDVVNWVTSCGTMHDFDLPAAYLRVEKEDPTEGYLGVVRRTDLGGVAWQIWPIRAEP